MIPLRPYQTRAYELVRGYLERGLLRLLLASPPGSGKTVMGAYFAHRKTLFDCRTLWIAHRNELIDQAVRTLQGYGLICGAIAPGSRTPPQPYAPVQVASIQTLARRGVWPEVDLVIWDECHHQAADTYRRVADQYPRQQHIGLSGTPERADGRPLDFFQELVSVADYSELLRDGYLVPCQVIAPNRTLKPGEIAQRPVDAYRTHTPGESVIVFSPTVEVAERHAEEFRGEGIEAECIEGKTARGLRRKTLDRFARGELKVITNVAILTEGTDLPRCSVVCLARGCGSAGLFIQMTARAGRPWRAPDGTNKAHATLLDLRGVSHIHGNPFEDRVYSLTGEAGIRRAAEPNPYPACLVCGAPKEPGTACQECGTAPRGTTVTVTGDVLSKWDSWRRKPESDRARSLAKWLRAAREKGHQAGSAYHKYKGVFGQWPSSDIKAEAERINRNE